MNGNLVREVKDQKEPQNITSVGENIFYHGIHFLKGRGWTEESLVESVRNHYRLYDIEPENPETETLPNEDKK